MGTSWGYFGNDGYYANWKEDLYTLFSPSVVLLAFTDLIVPLSSQRAIIALLFFSHF